MVALELQRDLCKEIEKIASSMKFKTPGGNTTYLNVYEQNLPMRLPSKNEMTDEEDEIDEEEELQEQFPYMIVKLDSGSSESSESPHVITTKLIAGIYDDSVKADGYKYILILFERIRERFRKNPILTNKFKIADEMEWALPDEDEETFPFFYGAMHLKWEAAEYRREDDFA